ncbi:type I secretion system permease/ATPase, partial [Mesorhizobium sp. M0152]
ANLDAEGEAAVVKAIASVRERKGIAVVVCHRPSAIRAVDLVLVMEGGRQRAFGARDEALSKVLKGTAMARGAGVKAIGSTQDHVGERADMEDPGVRHSSEQ